MNRNNLLRLAKYNLLAEIVGTDGGTPHLLINLPSGRRTGFAAPPFPFESDKFSAATAHLKDADKREFVEQDESCAIAARALATLARQGAAFVAATQDARASALAKRERIVEATTAALAEVGAQFAALDKIGAALERQHAELYAVPGADAASAVVDVEVRSLFRALPLQEQIQLLVASEERMLLALKRSPLALADEKQRELLETAWTARVADAQPEAVATLKIAEENHAWALGLVKHIASLIDSSAPPVFDRFNAYKLLRPTGGAAVLGFEGNEVRAFERKLAQAAA